MKAERKAAVLDAEGLEGGVRSRIFIVGTAHVSDKSIAQVKQVIEEIRPDIVAVELDEGRYKALLGENEVREVPVKELLSEGKFYYFLVHWLLSYVQRKIGRDMGVKPGAEMLAAIQKAEEIGAMVALVDRDIRITLQRFWAKMSFFEKIKLFISLISAGLGWGNEEIDIDTVTDQDVVSQLISELREFSPTAATVLIDERDAYIAGKLLEAARHGRVVAVLGAGHRDGVQKYLENPETIPPLENFTVVPKKRFSIIKALTLFFVLTAVALLALLIYSGGISPRVVLTALFYLFITQGILSGLGVLLARGHILSALTAFSLAWFGFIHPFLAVGWLAGLVEAHFRPPTTQDFKSITEVEDISQLLGNRLFRIILVAALANLGSMAGTFIAIPLLVKYLGIQNPLGILKMAVENIF